MKTMKLATAFAVLAAPVLAEGDADAGQALFERQCVSCHVVANDDGEVLVGRNAKTGPNLYGVVGRVPGTYADYSYGDALAAAAESYEGVWTEEAIAAYMQDPTAWLRDNNDDPRARSKMTFRVRSEEDAVNIAAFLATYATEAEEASE